MQRDYVHYQTYLQILKEELVPVMRCTEPIATAYGFAKARELLGAIPDKVIVEVSANIIKNVKSVVVPNTNGYSQKLENEWTAINKTQRKRLSDIRL